MEAINITTDNAERFAAVLTEDVKENIGRKYYRGIGLLDEEEKPSGCLVWEYKNVNEETDIEAEIVRMSFSEGMDPSDLFAAYETGIREECIARSRFDLTGETKRTAEIFSAHGFDVRERESMDMILTLGELMDLKVFKRKPSSYIVPLSELFGREFRQGIMKCLYYERRGLLEDLSSLPINWYDQTISCAARTDEEVTGFLLVHKLPSGIFMPVLLFAVGPDHQTDLLDMMRFAAQAAAAEYPPDTKILIRRRNPAIRGLVKKMFPEKNGEKALAGERMEK